MKSTNYGGPHYAILSTLLLIHPPLGQNILLCTPSSNTLNVCFSINTRRSFESYSFVYLNLCNIIKCSLCSHKRRTPYGPINASVTFFQDPSNPQHPGHCWKTTARMGTKITDRTLLQQWSPRLLMEHILNRDNCQNTMLQKWKSKPLLSQTDDVGSYYCDSDLGYSSCLWQQSCICYCSRVRVWC
jgi:hypothetical protein